VFFKIVLGQHFSRIPLQIDRKEVDAVLWLSRDQLGKVLRKEDEKVIGFIPPAKGEPKTEEFSLLQLAPTWPNEMGEGLGKGHYFAIKYLMSSYY